MKNKTRQTRHAFNSCRASRAYYKFMSVLYSSLCLHVEEEVHDIAVLDHVVLSLDSHLSGFADSALASEGHVVVILYNLRTDKAFLKIRMDYAGTLRSFYYPS